MGRLWRQLRRIWDLAEDGTPDAPARLAEAQAILASMPTDTLPGRWPLPAGSRMPLAPNPLFVGRGDELLQVANTLRGGDTTVALGQVVGPDHPDAVATRRALAELAEKGDGPAADG